MKLVIIAAIALCGTAPALAQVVSMESQNPAPKQLTGDPNKIICELVQRTGSRLDREKVCLTAAQWKENRTGQRHDLEKWQMIVNQEPSDPNGMTR